MDMNAAMNEMIAAIEAMDPEILAGGIVFFAGLFAAIVAFSIIRYLLKSIGFSKMFCKAGVAGWKAFIPFCNDFNKYKISWNGKFYFLFLALHIAVFAITEPAGIVMNLIAMVVSIAFLIVAVKQNVKMARNFGKGTGTGIALLFFPGITSLILGMGKAEFQGEKLEN